MYVKEVLVFV